MRHFFTHFSTQGEEISLAQLLLAREERVSLQQKFISIYKQTLLSVTLVAVGGIKKNALTDYIFQQALEKLAVLFQEMNIKPIAKLIREPHTGHEAFFVVSISATKLKRAVIELEDNLPLARLWDLDVINAQGNLLSRAKLDIQARQCLICHKEAKICARSRYHSVEQLWTEMQERAQAHYFAEQVGEAVYQALLQEAELTPKPGLVDAENNGSHKDMNLQSFRRSAVGLRSFFVGFVLKGMQTASLDSSSVLAEIRPLGLAAEQAMLKVTGGVNTHKGAIFSFGLVCCSIGRLYQLERKNCLQITAICHLVADITRGLTAELEYYPINLPLTAGVRLYRQFGLSGARGAAESGFRLIQILLPKIEQYTEFDWQHRLLVSLLHLIAENPDTNVVNRGGLQSLRFMQETAQDLLADQKLVSNKYNLIQALKTFDSACIERNLSPGGSADLLALIIFFQLLRGN
ncbi:triphosphoribosyl-dephospho-CoA synthase CitG [Rodentibacter caecimuris]|uniref:Probable 2-(5''-triphosphoribosyl)-3'-dephosphocoenzyme-A synthase n=1 Tax=Rodentibacter caecimuris TaxID=1796644 RepID=A0ABX3KWB3_9PAST|nr:2-(5'-triphosphoribosyl)-3'-dephospho CoA synthase [Rodentibacter heylii]